MEEGTKSKKTVFVGGLAENVDENLLLETFSTFGKHPTDPCNLSTDSTNFCSFLCCQAT